MLDHYLEFPHVIWVSFFFFLSFFSLLEKRSHCVVLAGLKPRYADQGGLELTDELLALSPEC